MTQLAAQRNVHQLNFSHLQREQSAAPDWLERLRHAAMQRFDEVGFPTRAEEAWRFTNIDAITKTRFALPGAGSSAAAEATVGEFSFGDDAAMELVFINGHYNPRLSRLGKLAQGVRVQSLAEALTSPPLALEKHLGKYARITANPFVALNTGFVRDGALIYLPKGVTVEGPLHLLFVTAPTDEPIVTHPRVLIVAEENTEAMVVENYVGKGALPYFTNAVTEMVIAADAHIDHCKLQQESHSAQHLASTQVHLASQAHFVSHSVSIGAALTRNDLGITLGGERADATINGLVLLDGNRHCDNHTLLDHAAAHCPSHELYKHVLAGKSTGVFKGQILVRKDSQKTDSKQTSKTLLLSDDAVMSSMPALEIYADDVKCTHGSTTGPVDEEQVFYLRSRGVSHDAARHLLTYAFAADITRRIRVEPVRARVENFMAAQHGLPIDLRISDLGAHDEAVVNS